MYETNRYERKYKCFAKVAIQHNTGMHFFKDKSNYVQSCTGWYHWYRLKFEVRKLFMFKLSLNHLSWDYCAATRNGQFVKLFGFNKGTSPLISIIYTGCTISEKSCASLKAEPPSFCRLITKSGGKCQI